MLDSDKIKKAGKKSKLNDFAKKLRTSFAGGKDMKKGKVKTKTTFQKLFGE